MHINVHCILCPSSSFPSLLFPPAFKRHYLNLHSGAQLEYLIYRVGQDHIYIRCIYGIFGRDVTKYTVIYGVYIRIWPTLLISRLHTIDSRGSDHKSTEQQEEKELYRTVTLKTGSVCVCVCVCIYLLLITLVMSCSVDVCRTITTRRRSSNNEVRHFCFFHFEFSVWTFSQVGARLIPQVQDHKLAEQPRGGVPLHYSRRRLPPHPLELALCGTGDRKKDSLYILKNHFIILGDYHPTPLGARSVWHR